MAANQKVMPIEAISCSFKEALSDLISGTDGKALYVLMA
jgi:hypothetical protein